MYFKVKYITKESKLQNLDQGFDFLLDLVFASKKF
jgi:hypothetical protein